MSDPLVERPLRKDAQRNRDQLLAVARTAFAAADHPVTLESVARDAGVGIGTLYRHFPSREALAEAVYAAELDVVTDSVPMLLATLPPDRALRAWMTNYSLFFTTKRGMMDVLRAGWASGRIVSPGTRARITGSIASLLEAGVGAGTLRSDVSASDITSMLLGVFLSLGTTGDARGPEPLLDLVFDAVRVRG